MKYLQKTPFSVKMCPEGMTQKDWDAIFAPKKRTEKQKKFKIYGKIYNLGDPKNFPSRLLDM